MRKCKCEDRLEVIDSRLDFLEKCLGKEYINEFRRSQLSFFPTKVNSVKDKLLSLQQQIDALVESTGQEFFTEPAKPAKVVARKVASGKDTDGR